MQILVFLLFTAGVGGVVIQTPTHAYSYQVYWLVSRNFKFKANTTDTALLFLGNAMANDGFEIVLGAENKYSCIRPCISCSCLDFKYHSPFALWIRNCFWLFWDSISISIGGALNIGENVFFTYHSQRLLLLTKHIFIRSWYNTFWEIPDYLTFATKENLQNTTIYWDVVGVSSALFSIETCGRVDIIFTTNLAHVFYKVALGDCSNRCTTIQKVLSNNTESSPTTVTVDMNPLGCSRYEDVWISWENTTNRLEVGTGQVLRQDVFAAMDNMDNDAIVERMMIHSSLSAMWKIDVYGCEFSNWQEWNSWTIGVTSGRLTKRSRACHCKRPSFHPTFDGDFHCDGEFEQQMDDGIKSSIWRSKGNMYSATLAKFSITEITRIKCGVECDFMNACSIFSYNTSNKTCWLYNVQHFNINDFTENKNVKTYIWY